MLLVVLLVAMGGAFYLHVRLGMQLVHDLQALQGYTNNLQAVIASHTATLKVASRMAANTASPAAALSPLLGELRGNMVFHDVALYDAGGRRSDGGRGVLPSRARNWPGLLQARQGTVVSCASDDFNVMYMYIAMPVMTEDGAAAEVLAGALPIAMVVDAIGLPRENGSHYFYLQDQQGRVIFHTNWAGMAMPVNSADGSGQVLRRADDGAWQIYFYSAVPGTDWRLVMGQPLWAFWLGTMWRLLPELLLIALLALSVVLLWQKQRRIARQEQEKEALQLEKMMSVSQFAAGVAHEIKNPLTTVQGFLQLMAAHADRPPQTAHIALMLDELARVERLIQEFTQLARPATPPVFQKVKLNELLRDVVCLMESQALLHQAVISFTTGEVPLVRGDSGRLKQVFINLVKNALEAVTAGGKVEIVSGRDDSGAAVVRVSDNGRGMEAALLARAGTPFVTTKAQGTGLGLSVCKSILAAHGGRLTITSQVGQGTTVIVVLPAVAAAGADTTA